MNTFYNDQKHTADYRRQMSKLAAKREVLEELYFKRWQEEAWMKALEELRQKED